VRAAALLGPLAILLGCALTAWPVAALARRAGAAPLAAARAGALWAVLPGPAVMAPQFDQLLALPVAAAGALLGTAVAGSRLRPGPAVAAGLAGGVALQLSYGAAAFVAITGGAALAAGPRDRRRAAAAAAIAAASAALVVAIPVAWGHEPLLAARTALAFHREAYTAPRSYGLWLAFNPLDLAVFLGVPVAVLFAVATARSFRGLVRGAGLGPADRLRLAAASGTALLALSGAVRGEVGRIWIPLLPVLLAAAVTSEPEGPSARGAALLAAGLAALTFAVGMRWLVG
jgi:hypothetical protein